MTIIWTTLINGYFEWLKEFVYDETLFTVGYDRLFKKLFETEFRYLPMDKNRALDGVYLRYRYTDSEYINDIEAEKEFDIFPCSVLEVLIALALRCEEDIMGNDMYGNRTGQWFWEMLDNIGLVRYNDTEYDENAVDICIERFLDRDYGEHGEYCAFKLDLDNYEELRRMELWYQMQQHIIDISGGRTNE